MEEGRDRTGSAFLAVGLGIVSGVLIAGLFFYYQIYKPKVESLNVRWVEYRNELVQTQKSVKKILSNSNDEDLKSVGDNLDSSSIDLEVLKSNTQLLSEVDN